MPAFAKRMSQVRRSFIREILKVTADPSIISFAGGLPKPDLFPTGPMADAAARVLAENGPAALQYSVTEGEPALREWIAARYKAKKNLDIDPAHILVTNGSQQSLDLLGKVFLDPGDLVGVELPGYIGAIQAFSIFEPAFAGVPLGPEGPDLDRLTEVVLSRRAKMFYAVPNFQNPSGLTYSLAARRAVAEILRMSDTVFVEDDPYGELRFFGEPLPPVTSFLTQDAYLLGTFSKIAAPGLRLGWVVATPDTLAKLVTAKQASDLHCSTLVQRILIQFLADNDLDAHIATIRAVYGAQRDLMIERIKAEFPAEVTCTEPEGGMFLWVTLPEGCSAFALFDLCIKEKVAFVPGGPFFVDGGGERTLRLNFSNADPERIAEGIARMGKGIKTLLARPGCASGS
ncbi:putative transcriptional regulator, GntR family [Solidesulfovibrio carbinoliphilus subsp. oakridgensis]|uniref:Transcriptional regulator, GntR family n=1 Tax=Solidesulfovibrio carbinoliphilus subsp. oakridgensis TaxID=694327 RepID=G7Q743_9BACT|nr:PLP-dependent aminotransferase family protein [Solidesulfovibrio carbinoliphilus]EHJ49000.1 putative transcriptional regulator, GntR family [Solidesulfovibrio carbinoliphilus subsp. oakridgensis]